MDSAWILKGNHNEGWVRVWCPAKINLFLKILKRLPNGYHEIQSLMLPIHLADEIEIIAQDTPKELVIECTDPTIPIDHTNLAAKAFHALKARGMPLSGVSISIDKRIPAGAGLGGGSSDAAGVLKGLDFLFNLNLTRQELLRVALSIGADVPFFLMEQPCLVTGIGEILKPLNIRQKMWLLLGFPGFSISTKKAYEAVDAELTNTKTQVNMPLGLGGEVRQKGGERRLTNDLESPVFVWYPALKAFREKLEKLGAVEARMTGSGSSIFGIFEEKAKAEAAMTVIRKDFTEWKLYLTQPVWQGFDDKLEES